MSSVIRQSALDLLRFATLVDGHIEHTGTTEDLLAAIASDRGVRQQVYLLAASQTHPATSHHDNETNFAQALEAKRFLDTFQRRYENELRAFHQIIRRSFSVTVAEPQIAVQDRLVLTQRRGVRHGNRPKWHLTVAR